MSRYRKELYVAVIALLSLSWILPGLMERVWAHGPLTGKGHNEEAKTGPHGGMANRYGINYVEFLVEPASGIIKIYFTDKNMAPIAVPTNHSASGYISTDNGPIVWVSFKACSMEAGSCLEADTGLLEPDSFKAVISIKIGDKRDNFRFKWVSASGADEAYRDQSEEQ